MERNEESSQDVDITILPDTEQPRNVADSGDVLPHFQFLDGGGALQNSTDRPFEGFVALKITYEHVFRKQREQTRLLQQKIKQLGAEIEQLKREKGGSVLCHTKVEQGPCDTATDKDIELSNNQHLHVAAQLINTSNEDVKDIDLQLATLDANKTKLRSGLVRLASCLLKRELGNSPLSDLLKKILGNLHSSECDSEETIRELCILVEEMGTLDDSIKLETNQEPDQRQLPTTCSSGNASDSSLQKLVTNYQLQCQDSECESRKKLGGRHQFSHLTDRIEREQSQDEDMYGPEGTPANSVLVPYNLTRLHLKLMKLQQFPAEYRSMTQHIPSVSLQQQREDTGISWNEAVSSPSGLPTYQMPSFLGIHSIKLPPADLPSKPNAVQKGDFTSQTVLCNREVPVTTTRYIEASGQALNTGNLSPRKSTTPLSSETEIQKVNALHQSRQLPIARKRSDQGFPASDTNISCAKSSETLKDILSFEQACGPPTQSPKTAFDANTFSEWHSPHNAVSPVCHAPPTHGISEHQMSDLAPSVSSSERKECVAGPPMTSSPNLVPPPVKTETADSKRTEWTLANEYPQSPYIAGSESTRDQLVTAHTSMHYVPVNITQMECPVCQHMFPQNTSEETVTSHVNLHFDEQLQRNDSFEILNG